MTGTPTHPQGTGQNTQGNSPQGAGTLDELSSGFTSGYSRRDAVLLADLYLPTARVWLEHGPDAVPVSAATGIEDRMRLGVPVHFTVQHAFEDGLRAHVRLAWTVEGTTPDGSLLAMEGASALDCENRGGRWYIAAEWTLHGNDVELAAD